MPTTTEARPPPNFLKAAPLALACWFSFLAILTPLAEPTRDVLVFGPLHAIERLPSAGAMLVDVGNGWTRARRAEPGFVARLYANGAWLVLPAFESGCNRAVAPRPAVASR